MDDDQIARLVRRILRVNHAGEHGAEAIYLAQIAQLGRRHPELQVWLRQTLDHERRHRSAFRDAMPARNAKPCRALSVWSIGGAALGRVTALLGPRGIVVCTAAVERTVHGHLDEQIAFLAGRDERLADLIKEIQIEEDEHLAFAEARHDPRALGARLLSAFVSVATTILIALSTRGDSLRLRRALRADPA